MKKIILAISTLIIVYGIYAFISTNADDINYADSLALYRYERAEYFRNASSSPFLTQKVNFGYLDYFPMNEGLRVKAKFNKKNKLDTLSLATSTGSIDRFIVVGVAAFKIDDTQQQLLVLKSMVSDDGTLFIPFQDKTSGETTYGGGRYLDVLSSSGNSILLDFNKCYNPYCAYTQGYTCPFPPKENRLTVAIEAGEKSYPSY